MKGEEAEHTGRDRRCILHCRRVCNVEPCWYGVLRARGWVIGSVVYFKKASLMLGVNLIGVEHWVGGILEFAHSGISKTHTRLGGVSERLVFLVFS
jgi:hypothetical protein